MEEIWKDVTGYEGLYMVSNLGKVASVLRQGTKGNILTPTINKRGYHFVGLNKDHVRKNFKVHRLVAVAFIPNPCGYSEINHIDGDKSNNCVENLEWTDRKGNMGHARQMGVMKNARAKLDEWNSANWKIPVISTNVKTGAERRFDCISDAASALGVQATKISACLKGKRKSTGGYTFRKAVIE